jgi:putative nucleotidyltransferase with HDIG domain
MLRASLTMQVSMQPPRTMTLPVPGGASRSSPTAAIVEEVDRVAAAIVADTQGIKRSLPDVAAEVLQLCQTDADAVQIEKSLMRDPFISAQLISMANSAMFAPRMPIVGVRDAVVRVGLDAVRDIVIMVVTQSTMYRLPGFDKTVNFLRQRSMTTAVAARSIAKTLRVQTDYAFLAGLLHDIGELVLLERCVKQNVLTAEVMAMAEIATLVNGRIEQLHTDVGASVCRAWKLPQGVVDAAQFHHRYRVDDKHYLGANLVAAADVMADHLGISTTPRPLDPNDPVFADVGLGPDKVEVCIQELTKQLPALLKGK